MINQWVSGFLAFILYFMVLIFYIIAGVTLNSELVWVELAFYVVLQVSSFFLTLNKLPLAYQFFYLAESLPKPPKPEKEIEEPEEE